MSHTIYIYFTLCVTRHDHTHTKTHHIHELVERVSNTFELLQFLKQETLTSDLEPLTPPPSPEGQKPNIEAGITRPTFGRRHHGGAALLLLGVSSSPPSGGPTKNGSGNAVCALNMELCFSIAIYGHRVSNSRVSKLR